MKKQHTKGPWFVEEDVLISSRTKNIGMAHFPSRIGSGTNVPSPTKANEARANARLMAAAPEMLWALQMIFSGYGQYFSKEDVELVANLLNKAEGVQR